MPEYTHLKEAGRQENHSLIHSDTSHLFPADLLHRSTSCIPPEKGCPEPLQVAQKGEFRYMGWQICQYCSLIALIRYELASKMIANGCFWTDNRLAGRTMDLQTGNNRLFGISFPEGMIQDPCNQIDGGPGTYALILWDTGSVGAPAVLLLKKGVRNGIRLHKRVNSGTWFRRYGRIVAGLVKFSKKGL